MSRHPSNLVGHGLRRESHVELQCRRGDPFENLLGIAIKNSGPKVRKQVQPQLCDQRPKTNITLRVSPERPHFCIRGSITVELPSNLSALDLVALL